MPQAWLGTVAWNRASNEMMLMTVELNGLVFHPVEAQTVILGSTKGGWMYAGQRPCHEVKLPSFFVMGQPLNEREVATAMGVPLTDQVGDRPMETLTSIDVHELAQHLMESEDFKQKIEELPGRWEVRPLTQSEWQAAAQGGILNLPPGCTERLADAPASNHRGAMMDGRPRPNELLGPASQHVAAIAVHPKNRTITAMTSLPHDRPLPNVVARLALSPLREGSEKRVPETTDRWGNLRSELLWTTLLGIVPSFLIPVLRGMGDYATEGWVNLLFGGLCAGFLTGAVWRPQRPMLRYDDVS